MTSTSPVSTVSKTAQSAPRFFGTFLGCAREDILPLGHKGERHSWAHDFGAGRAGEGPLDEGVADAKAVHGGAGGGGAHLFQLLDQFRLRAGDGAAVNGQGHAGGGGPRWRYSRVWVCS